MFLVVTMSLWDLIELYRRFIVEGRSEERDWSSNVRDWSSTVIGGTILPDRVFIAREISVEKQRGRVKHQISSRIFEEMKLFGTSKSFGTFWK